jgi:hypothetical protein
MRRRTLLAPALCTAVLSACGTRVVRLENGDRAVRGRVLLLRGLANVFSTGIDALASRVAAAGYRAEVGNHLGWAAVARRVVADERNGGLRRPLAVIGHSLGADDAIRLSGAAGAAGVPTDLLVTFDPVWVAEVPPGPKRVLNFHQSHGLWGRALAAGRGFAGRIDNIDLNDHGRLNHLNIEKDPALHTVVISVLDALAQHAVRREIGRGS